MKEGYRQVTLLQLLSHTGGIPGGVGSEEVWSLAYKGFGEAKQRPLCLEKLLTEVDPVGAPGERYEYSNWGYTLAGFILEKHNGRSYEELLTKYVTEPLGITSLGYGAPKGKGSPWGHGEQSGWKPKDPEESGSDNPLGIAPAGTMHLAMSDWGRFIAACTSQKLAESVLGVKPEIFEVSERSSR